MNRRAERYHARKRLLKEEQEQEFDEQEQDDVEVGGNNTHLPFECEGCLEPVKIISLFKQAFEYVLASEDLTAFIQEVKGLLYHRDYLAAFNSDDKRYAYAARWTPARALAYSSLFGSHPEIVEVVRKPAKVLTIGGGACGEMVGLALMVARQNLGQPFELDIIDIADWRNVIGGLGAKMKETWFGGRDAMTTSFIHDDVLSYQFDISYDLITILFTTNELFTEKRKETIAFLNRLSGCKPGALLLMAESAGSYSNIEIGSKKFPVQFLVDMILVGKRGENNGAWEVVSDSESCWYRVKEADYPMKLENMRFFYRLYRRK